MSLSLGGPRGPSGGPRGQRSADEEEEGRCSAGTIGRWLGHAGRGGARRATPMIEYKSHPGEEGAARDHPDDNDGDNAVARTQSARQCPVPSLSNPRKPRA